MLPVRIIWQITITLRQKIALSFSLCLTVVLVVVTAVRVAGLEVQQTIDPVWSQYWVLVSAMAGLMVNSATALRWLFVARSTPAAKNGHRRRHRPQQQQQQQQPQPPAHYGLENCGNGDNGAHAGGAAGWASKILASLGSAQKRDGNGAAASVRPELSTGVDGGSCGDRGAGTKRGGGYIGRRQRFRRWWLLSDDIVPRGTMTGMRTFIWGAEGSVIGGGTAAAATSAATDESRDDPASAIVRA